MSLPIRQIEAYVFRRRGRAVQVLALKRSSDRRTLPGIWQPVTGGRRRSETIFAAAAREVREETGLAPRRWWLLESPLLYFDRESGAPLALPRFAAEIGAGAEVRRSREHDDHRFVSPERAGRLFLWESQRHALRDLRVVWKGGSLAAALEIPPARFRRP
jgi:8-oxo-dGTP pyrophosphatase MutT (NUDIX family)